MTASGEFGSSGLTNSEYLFDKGLINILKSDRFHLHEKMLQKGNRLSKSIHVKSIGSIEEETGEDFNERFETMTEQSHHEFGSAYQKMALKSPNPAKTTAKNSKFDKQ